MKSILGDSVIACVVPVQLPDDQRLVTAGGEDHVRVLGVGGDLGHPAIVTPQGSPQLQGLRHRNLHDLFFSETFHHKI